MTLSMYQEYNVELPDVWKLRSSASLRSE